MVVSSYDDPQDPIKLLGESLDVSDRIHNRRARSGVLAITHLQHSCDYLAVLANPGSPTKSKLPNSVAVTAKGKNKNSNRLKMNRILIQRLRHGLLPLPSSLPWKGHISTL